MTSPIKIIISTLRTEKQDPAATHMVGMNRAVDQINDQYWFDEVLPAEERRHNSDSMLRCVSQILTLALSDDHAIEQNPTFGAGQSQRPMPVLTYADPDLDGITLRAGAPLSGSAVTITTAVPDIDTLLTRGGYVLTEEYESITLQHVLDGVAGLIADAVSDVITSMTNTEREQS